ncbi:MAG: FAD-binding oxidoreductase [SAR324 cluster bacterium]|nr:FAD-binding oxidoreductase [SAR324 cluster bacterium]
MKIANWGNYPVVNAVSRGFETSAALKQILSEWSQTIPRGMGRSYGDASLGEHVVSTLKHNHILEFDSKQGIVTCEAGVTLAELLEIFVPRGFFPGVTPGTRFITIGGGIAADVHGKNHHKEGSFSSFVESFDLMTGDGRSLTCSRKKNSELFWATFGAMGLTGIVMTVTMRLKPIQTAYIRQETHKAGNLDEIMALFEDSEDWTYTVAWIDCLAQGNALGRSVLMRGESATLEDMARCGLSSQTPLLIKSGIKLDVPVNFPGWVLNSHTVKAFNELYYWKYPDQAHESVIPYDPFFYPLDSIYHWNRIYGKNGFLQYQFVIPKEVSREGLTRILKEISVQGQASFLAVLKLFGKQNPAPLSFPMEGYTLALDFAVKPGIFEFLDRLDQIVLDYGGRLYLAKDARMKPDFFHQTYADNEQAKQMIQKYGKQKFASMLSQRLGVTS